MTAEQLARITELMVALNRLDGPEQFKDAVKNGASELPYFGDIPVYIDGSVVGTLSGEVGDWLFAPDKTYFFGDAT